MIVKEKKEKSPKVSEENVRDLFSVGAQYGYSRSRRHPSATPFIFGVKNRVEIFDLEKTEEKLLEAESFVEELGKQRKTILFVGGKNEARKPIEENAKSIDQPYVAGRWVGGTITNFSQINQRVQKLDLLETQREKGNLAKYTKKERLLLDREVEELERKFGGIRDMTELPSALFIVDIRREHTAFEEARQKNIPVITLSSSNCDLSKADIAIPGNDSTRKSIDHILSRISEAYKRGLKQAPLKKDTEE